MTLYNKLNDMTMIDTGKDIQVRRTVFPSEGQQLWNTLPGCNLYPMTVQCYTNSVVVVPRQPQTESS